MRLSKRLEMEGASLDALTAEEVQQSLLQLLVRQAEQRWEARDADDDEEDAEGVSS